MDWYTCSKTFMAIVASNSFSKAAERLYISPSVVSKRMQWLEDKLKTKLLVRTTRDLKVTDAGNQYYSRISPLFCEWDSIKSDVSKSHLTPNGVLRVAMPTIAGNYYIENLISKFSDLYPDIKLELYLGESNRSFLGKDIDVNVNTADLSSKADYIYKRLQGPTRRIYASPNYLSNHEEPKSLQDLKSHNCITHISHRNNIWILHQDVIQVNGNLVCNNAASLLKAVESGGGVCLIADAFVQEELAYNKVKHILQDYYSDPIDIYLNFPALKKLSLNVKVFIGFLENEMSFPLCQRKGS